MALNEKKRQKKLQKRKARRKEVAKALRRSTALGAAVSNRFGDLATPERLARASDGPLYQCLAPREIFDNGIGTVVVSREVGDGLLATAILLVDTFCLGVKDAFLRILTPWEYEEFVEGLGMNETLERVTPAYARKLVEGSIAYARASGLEPHPDYENAKRIWGAIDPAECPTEFEYGKDGKPLYVSGPNDTLARQRQIVDALMRSRGTGEFDYVIGLNPGGGLLAGDSDEFLDDDEDDEEGDDEGERP